MKLKIGLFGASGRMGQEIAQVIQNSEGLELFYPVNRKENWDDVMAKAVDVWIDFSLPDATDMVIQKVQASGKPLVSGTTGLSLQQHEDLKNLSTKVPVLWASNMSLGVAVLNQALRVLGAIKHFDFQVEEIHHIRKKDKPSGTAVTLQQNLQKAVSKSLPEPVAIRGGGVYGEHRILALGEEEVLTFSHSALNRTVFAKGAVKAAEWIAQQPPGYYSISDMLFKV